MTSITGLQAIGGRRMCGSGRKAGELYLECGTAHGGTHIENMLMDLPMLIDTDIFALSPIGVSTFQDHLGVTHVLDWVGESHYPEIADFIEEARRKGVSRKISHTAPIEGLSAESRLFLAHPRGRVTNAGQLSTPTGFACPCGKGHSAQDGCIGWAWHALPNHGTGERRLSDASYPVRAGHVPLEAEYGLAVFMVVPITALTVIRTPDGETLEERLERARQTGIPVLIADE